LLEPLQRDCACRGTDAGFVHLSCLTNFAAAKSVQALKTNDFINPWIFCSSCHQYYQNEFRIDIATNFVSFVRRQYPHNTQLQVESLYAKLAALNSMLEILQPVQKKEAVVTADVFLSLIDRIKTEVSSLPIRYSEYQAFAYGTLGRFAFDEGTEESARRAVNQLEKQLVVNEAIGNDDGIATAKANIAIAKSRYEGVRDNEELLNASQDVYKLCLAKNGEGSEFSIAAGTIYACNLQKANRGVEAIDLLTKLLATSKQVLGSDHKITKEVVLALHLAHLYDND
jgi:hypothetical protein